MDGRVRRALLGLFVFGGVGAGSELWLLDHNQKTLQWVPLVLLASGLGALAWQIASGRRSGVRLFQAVMLLYVASGGIGTLLHFRTNLEFEREIHPEAPGGELFYGAIKGATPTLAPGTMILLGSIGLLYAYRHPNRGDPDGASPAPEEGT
jgi:hypothetical protein